jgi:hypothetical protein
LVFFGTFSLVDFLILVAFFDYSALLWKAVLVFLLTACSAVLWKAVSVALLTACSAVLWKAVSVALLTACSAVLWKAVLVALLTDYSAAFLKIALALDGALFSLRISRLDGLLTGVAGLLNTLPSYVLYRPSLLFLFTMRVARLL